MLAYEHGVHGALNNFYTRKRLRVSACSLVVRKSTTHSGLNSMPRTAFYCSAWHFRLVAVPKRIILFV